MKRFWKEVAVEELDGTFRVTLDGRAIRTQGGGAQVVPTRPLAEALAEEWRGQGEDIDPVRFVMRDMADFAIDQVRPERAATIAELLRYAETDTLCYRADPEEHLYRRQLEMWEPLLGAAEARWDIHFTRVSGIVHRPQPEATVARLRSVLEGLDDFALAALRTMTPIAASLTVTLAALEDGADTQALFAAANCEQDWQAELWGWDLEAENARARRLSAFETAATFARLAKA
ncbi:molecular chaperone [Croceibacterium sp. LX-88]|jgi:chaperone required for assembly of F1-ATPase|uniref:Molecular chaperone n=1 Tax=Croceibacterium selenioxidans TaxID=2838833 RepID=A0ABS5W499_9SPHN|nr:ATP12 family protein [Croceibacterium selenioxidans]MBT2134588.1 molecular chaperone [Croceibacterium selenioxidans]